MRISRTPVVQRVFTRRDYISAFFKTFLGFGASLLVGRTYTSNTSSSNGEQKGNKTEKDYSDERDNFQVNSHISGTVIALPFTVGMLAYCSVPDREMVRSHNNLSSKDNLYESDEVFVLRRAFLSGLGAGVLTTGSIAAITQLLPDENAEEKAAEIIHGPVIPNSSLDAEQRKGAKSLVRDFNTFGYGLLSGSLIGDAVYSRVIRRRDELVKTLAAGEK